MSNYKLKLEIEINETIINYESINENYYWDDDHNENNVETPQELIIYSRKYKSYKI
jgi:hypothetical protein